MFEVRKIDFLEGLYATNDGRILDKEFNEVHKWVNDYGYYMIWCNGKKWRVHRIIAKVFIPNPQNKGEVHHINFDKLDNRAENLLWLTREEHTSLHQKGNKNMLGKHHSEETREKISDAKKGKIPKANPPKPVYQYTLDGKLVKIWDSASEAGRNGFCQVNITQCCNGKRKTHKGYIWSYVPL